MVSLQEKIRALLLQVDPIGIYDPEARNDDEYDSEIRVILERLPSCQTPQEIQAMLWEVFSGFFTPSIAGSQEHYRDLAQKISELR